MSRPNLDEMTLREKIGQTAIVDPECLKKGVARFGSYAQYLSEFPFGGIYVDDSMIKADGEKFDSPKQLAQSLSDASDKMKIPMFVSSSFEQCANDIFGEMPLVCANMAIGAAQSKELAYKKGYLWAKTMKTLGINWILGPDGDLEKSFFSSYVTRIGSNADVIKELYPHMIKGVQAAGVAAAVKHFPGNGKDFRDTDFCLSINNTTIQEWENDEKNIYEAAKEAGVMSFVMSHTPMPAFDDSLARGGFYRPASASKKIIDILREKIGFTGVVVTDDIHKKNVSAAFEHDDIYIECFNAGNDIILFAQDDYIDVMEKAVTDGRVSMEKLDASVEKILDMKEKLGIFENKAEISELTEEDKKNLYEMNYSVAKSALTLLANEGNMIPFAPEKVKNVTIINISRDKKFFQELGKLKNVFEKRNVRANIMDFVRTKEELDELSQSEDIIIYACVPERMNFYSSRESMSTLFHSLAHGINKTVVVSFGAPSVYYNYFENAYAYVNAYAYDEGTMNALVDGLLGEFEFTGKTPVALAPVKVNR